MRVILLKDIAGVGQKGDVKEIADGFAQNKLIPQGLAEQATPEKLAAHESAQKREAAERAKEKTALAKSIQALEGVRIEISARATEKGGLFKSIGTKEIMAALAKKGSSVPEDAVRLPKPIKEIGEYEVELAFGDVRVRITTAITPVR